MYRCTDTNCFTQSNLTWHPACKNGLTAKFCPNIKQCPSFQFFSYDQWTFEKVNKYKKYEYQIYLLFSMVITLGLLIFNLFGFIKPMPSWNCAIYGLLMLTKREMKANKLSIPTENVH